MSDVIVVGGVSGRYRLVKRDAETMEVTGDTGWFDNLILDLGTNRLSVGSIADVCVVGTGNTVPVVTQTSLVAIVGSTTQIEEYQSGVNASSPWYNWVRRRFRFAAGAAAGNLSEVGVGWATNQLWSRALIVDGGGSPTTITVLPTEVLDVWYEMRVYASEADVAFQLQVGPVLHDCVLRPANTDSAWISAVGAGSIFQPFSDTFTRAQAYDGAIGPITGVPAGTPDNTTDDTITAYVNNSRQRDIVHRWGLNDGNFSGGIDAVRAFSPMGQYQIGFTPPIDKTNVKELRLTFRWAWARHTP